MLVFVFDMVNTYQNIDKKIYFGSMQWENLCNNTFMCATKQLLVIIPFSVKTEVLMVISNKIRVICGIYHIIWQTGTVLGKP
jgi:hypothetical protein